MDHDDHPKSKYIRRKKQAFFGGTCSWHPKHHKLAHVNLLAIKSHSFQKFDNVFLFNMKFSLLTLAALLSLTQAAPAELENRASCTFTDAASVAKSKTSCSTITLNGIAVPAGTTLDLTGLKSGTNVRIHHNP